MLRLQKVTDFHQKNTISLYSRLSYYFISNLISQPWKFSPNVWVNNDLVSFFFKAITYFWLMQFYNGFCLDLVKFLLLLFLYHFGWEFISQFETTSNHQSQLIFMLEISQLPSRYPNHFLWYLVFRK